MTKIQRNSSAEDGLYVPFRELGTVTSEHPFEIYLFNDEYFLLAPTKHSYIVYDVQTLNLVFSGPLLETEVKAVMPFGNIILVQDPRCVHICARNQLRSSLKFDFDIISMHKLKDMLLISAAHSINLYEVSDTGLSLIREIKTDINTIHSLFIDEAILLYSDTNRVFIHDSSLSKTSMIFQSESSISRIIPTHMADLVLLILKEGAVMLFSLESNKPLVSIKDNDEPVAAALIGDDSPFIMIGYVNGLVKLWNLEKGRLESVACAHSLSVGTIKSLAGQKIFISNSPDNSIKIWAIENAEIRLIKHRDGHFRPITKLYFLKNCDDKLISAGKDGQVRVFSLSKDSRSSEVSQGSIEKFSKEYSCDSLELRLPEVSSFDIFETKPLKWADMVTSHRGLDSAFSWKVDERCIFKSKFSSSDSSEVSCLAISPCGNFVAIGTFSGVVDLYNLQSGILKASFNAHSSDKLVGIAFSYNGLKIFSFPSKGHVHIIDIKTKTLSAQANVLPTILGSRMLRSLEMMALFTHEFNIFLYDLNLNRVVRNFSGHKNCITDLTITSNNRFLISSSLDGSVKTWDIETSICIFSLESKSIPTSICLSNDMEFLAISTIESNDISVYCRSSSYTKLLASSRVDSLSEDSHLSSRESELSVSSSNRLKWLALIQYSVLKENSKPVILDNRKISAPFFLTDSSKPVTAKLERPDVVFNGSCVFSDMSTDDVAKFFIFSDWDTVYLEIMSIPSQFIRPVLIKLLNSIRVLLEIPDKFDIKVLLFRTIVDQYSEIILSDLQSYSTPICAIKQVIQTKWSPVRTSMDKSLCIASYIRSNR